MDPVALGLRFRALRIRAQLRQADLAELSGVARRSISELENGVLTHSSLEHLGRLATAPQATADVRLRWHGEDLDRLVDAAHAATVAAALARLTRAGWETVVEASFSIWGERGSIDLLAWDHATRTILVIEVKSVLPDVQAMLRDLDRKSRLATQIAAARGCRPACVGRLVVIADSPTARGRVRRQDDLLGTAHPDRGRVIRAWLRAPDGPISGLMFLSNSRHAPTARPLWRRQRVHPPKHAHLCQGGAVEEESGRDGPSGVGGSVERAWTTHSSILDAQQAPRAPD